MLGRGEVVLVRHGQTEWSLSGKHTGRSDISLTELGYRQAEALGKMLAGEEFDRIYSSPLRRAWETMERAGYGELGKSDENLMEWDYGIYEGLTTVEVRRDIADWSVWTHPTYQGETVTEVGQRADSVIERAVGAGGRIALFAHGHLLRILGARWMGMPADSGRNLSLDTATISILGWERENRVIKRWNEVCHLRSMDPIL